MGTLFDQMMSEQEFFKEKMREIYLGEDGWTPDDSFWSESGSSLDNTTDWAGDLSDIEDEQGGNANWKDYGYKVGVIIRSPAECIGFPKDERSKALRKVRLLSKGRVFVPARSL